eukprot:scaffold2529_cov363-Prasinococcus_capsulatus_cf.AAC.12
MAPPVSLLISPTVLQFYTTTNMKERKRMTMEVTNEVRRQRHRAAGHAAVLTGSSVTALLAGAAAEAAHVQLRGMAGAEADLQALRLALLLHGGGRR